MGRALALSYWHIIPRLLQKSRQTLLGHIGNWGRYAITFTVLNLCVSLVATYFWGLTGPLVGTLAAYLLVTAWALPMVLKRTFSWSPRALWARAAGPFWWAVPYGAMLYLVTRQRPPQNWFPLFAEAGLALFTSLALWWFAGLRTAERDALKARLRKAL